MPSNTLTRDMGLKVGPIVLGTFIKHYFDRVKARESADPDELLKQDEILYDEAFHVIRSFLHESTFHTVEELQGFSNTRTPSSPYTHLVRVLVPLSSCNEAASILVKVLGGENKAREIIGGVKWWQVRGIEGVDAQWIIAKKDWREAKRQRRMCRAQEGPLAEGHQPEPSVPFSNFDSDGAYENHMDEMRCILYLHGGGYYFGSVDQQRYSIQRHARKINGRVFAINYRLAPQYPFPCGLHDALAAYLYLIRPPPGVDHRPIKPAHIVIAGDSAGGGMSLALLQLIRDAGLPLPGGGILISPWCDLTHSFPSVHTNTPTDVIPPTGLSFHKPSLLWPPPPHDVSAHVHASLRQKLRHAFKMDDGPASSKVVETPTRKSTDSHLVPAPNMPVNVGENVPVPPVDTVDPQRLTLVTEGGERLEIDQQVHFYTQNSLLVHPLVSPGLGYLGGLPPLLFIASDKEVLRDEIIFTAHKAANPHKYPLKDQTRGLYPLSEGIQERHPQPTSVHLQVYDGTCHILPVLFLFSTPAKFCFRAMANFIKFVTGVPLGPSISVSGSSLFTHLTMDQHTSLESKLGQPDTATSDTSEADDTQPNPNATIAPTSELGSGSRTPTGSSVPRMDLLRRHLSFKSITTGRAFPWRSQDAIREDSLASSSSGIIDAQKNSGNRYAGEPSVYEGIMDHTTFEMIRERVSTQGVIRPLEPESDLDAFKVPEDLVGTISELAIKRYMHGEALFRTKFASTYKQVEKTRRKNLERMAKQDGKRFDAFRASSNNSNDPSSNGRYLKLKESLLRSPSWAYAWALDELEKPPPSSIVARRDTEEARELALVADRAVMEDTSELNPNSLWAAMMNFLAPPDRMNGNGKEKLKVANAVNDGDQTPTQEQVLGKEKGSKTNRTFSRIFSRR